MADAKKQDKVTWSIALDWDSFKLSDKRLALGTFILASDYLAAATQGNNGGDMPEPYIRMYEKADKSFACIKLVDIGDLTKPPKLHDFRPNTEVIPVDLVFRVTGFCGREFERRGW